MPPQPINFHDKLSRFTDHRSPHVVAELYDYQFKLVKIQGEFVWHDHADTDEAFIVLGGQMRIEIRNMRLTSSFQSGGVTDRIRVEISPGDRYAFHAETRKGRFSASEWRTDVTDNRCRADCASTL